MRHENWIRKSRGIDPLHTAQIFESSNIWRIPDLIPQPKNLVIPPDLFAYRYRDKFRTARPIVIHFNMDDYRFETVWTEPPRGLASVQREQVWAAASPDFSLWLEYPQAMQIWNTYRNRWVARYWQESGIIIIPSINWSSINSHEFCYAGIPTRQIVTLRTYRRSSLEEQANFLAGFMQMRTMIDPRAIIWFGDIPDSCDTSGLLIRQFPVGYHETSKKEQAHL